MPADLPTRIQISRRKGWRMPPGAINCARPGRWGNPWRVEEAEDGQGWMCGMLSRAPTREAALAMAIAKHREMIEALPAGSLDELRGHDLACWCPLDAPCHTVVLLEVANR